MLVSMSFEIGPVTTLRTRGIYNMILNRDEWFTKMEWIGTAKSEVEFRWNSALKTFTEHLWLRIQVQLQSCLPGQMRVMLHGEVSHWHAARL